jgi:hypothetical protein
MRIVARRADRAVGEGDADDIAAEYARLDSRALDLAAALHRETWLSHGVPRDAKCGWCESVAERLVAPAYEPLR